MKLLAIDTSSIAYSVAVLVDEDIKVRHEIAERQQAQHILPAIQAVLQEAGISLNQLDALAFGNGPGSFTGIRIAASVIQGIGYAIDLPIIPISSLAAVAQSAYMDLGWKQCWVAIDARIQEMYWAAYRVNTQGLVELVGKEMVCTPEQAIFTRDTQDWYGVGDAWQVYQNQIPLQPLQVDATRIPHALAIIALAKQKYLQKEWMKAGQVMLTYLRDEVARKERKR